MCFFSFFCLVYCKVKKFLKVRGSPQPIFAPLGGSGWKTTTFVQNHKFREDPQSGSREKAEYGFSYMYMYMMYVRTPPPFFNKVKS